MTKHLSITSVAAFMLIGGAVASAQDLPAYEAMGFPISPVQVSILGCSAQVQERATGPTITIDGVPATPHQMTVLTPRNKSAEANDRVASANRTKLR